MRCDAGDRGADAVHQDAPANDCRIVMEPAGPVVVADGRLCGSVGVVARSIERPSCRGAHAEHGEVVPRDESSVRMLGLRRPRVDACVDALWVAHGGQPIEGPDAIADVDVRQVRVEVSVGRAVAARISEAWIADDHEGVRIHERQLSQQHRVDERVDRAVGTDAESQAADHEGGDARVPAKRSYAEHDVLPQFAEQVDALLRGVALRVERQHRVPDAYEIAELFARDLSRGLGGHTRSDERVDARLEMKPDLVVHVIDEPSLAERNAEHAAHAAFPLRVRGEGRNGTSIAQGRWDGTAC